MSNSSYHHKSINPSQSENRNGDVDHLISQGDAMYDYERIPAAWNGFDEQPIVYQYGDASAWQNASSDEDAG